MSTPFSLPGLAAVCLATLLAAGCGERTARTAGDAPKAGEVASDPDARLPAASSSAPRPTDQWVGQWNGPEGTFLKIEGGEGQYEVTVRDLDGPRTFRGLAQDGHIRFQRDGVYESIRATDGAGTGMKWLQDKKDCLTVREGEGYCRG